MTKTIIYCRKSTDRSDRQQLSIDNQISEALKIAEREWLEVVKIFKESKSAKAPGRPIFNEMMAMFAEWKADSIITWKLNRLARNPVDEWTIKWSIQNWIIKAIYTESEVFKTWDNVLIMWMHFWMSTQYILDLKKDSKRWVNKKVSEWWVCFKAPLWYLNNRLEKTIEVDPIKSKWVKEIFELKASNTTYRRISEILFEKWISNKWKPFTINSLDYILKNKFYTWVVKYCWEYYKWDFKPIISKELFEKANKESFLYERKNIWLIYPLKWILKDKEWLFLNAYRQKHRTYYKTGARSSYPVNISEKLALEKTWKLLESYSFDENLKEIWKEIIIDILKKNESNSENEIKNIKIAITKLKNKRKNLLDLRIDWDIDKESYNIAFEEINKNLINLENQKNNLWKQNYEKKIDKIIELWISLSERYKQGNDNYKYGVLSNLKIELLINQEKELSIKENSLLKLLKFLNLQFGGTIRNRTGLQSFAGFCITDLPWRPKD